MARIAIEPAKAKGVLEQERSLESSLRSYSREVDSVRRGLRNKIAGQEQISARLREAVEQINREASATRAIHDGLSQVIQRYEQTENSCRDKTASAERTSVQENPGGSAATTEINPYEFKWDDFLLKELANLVGPFGWLITGGKKILSGNGWGALSEMIKGVGKIAKSVVGVPKADWASKLFGLTAATENTPFWKRIGDFSSKGKGINTICSWVGALISSGVDNFKEFGENSFGIPRFWAETIGESAIKIGEGALIGLGVSAVIGGAPVIAVGAATVAVTALVDWGLNSLVRFATGDPTAEWVDKASDLILDVGKGIINGGKEVLKEAGEAVGKVTKAVGRGVEAVGKGVKKIGEGISNFFSGCKWGGALCGAW